MNSLTNRVLFAIAWLGAGILPAEMGRDVGLQAADRLLVAAPEQVDGKVKISRHPAGQFLGVGSCAAAACHGGRSVDVNGRKITAPTGREYSIWIDQDPHATAYSALDNDTSKAIAQRLGLKSARTSAVCLNCHSPDASAGDFANANDDAHLIGRSRDGVSCESCHGASGRWLEPHKRKDWRTKFNDNARLELGFNDTRDALALSTKCVECHIGSPGRDVNHDLIAAGHPRLYFEMSAFLDRMPRHWSKGPKQKRNIDLEARVWAVGQFVAARAALGLLEERAALKQPNAVWPEFAENACFSCHHDLAQPPSWRQALNDNELLGQPKWGSWYFALVGDAARKFTNQAVAAQVMNDIRELQIEMKNPDPDRNRVCNQAHQLLIKLEDLAKEANAANYNNKILRELLTSLLDEAVPPLTHDWESSMQVFLGMAAVAPYDHGVWRNRGARGAQGSIFDELKNIRDSLRFPGAEQGGRYSSPSNFDGERIDNLTTSLEKLRQLLKTESSP